MELNSKRHKQILHILLRSETPLTSSELAEKLHVSSRTIKSDMLSLKSCLTKENVQLVSQKGVGYSIQDNHSQLENQLVVRYLNINSIPSEFLDRINYLIRRLISASDYLKIETLAEEMGLSRSALSGEIKETRKILKSYHINVKEKPNYGIKIEANEYDLRLCLVDYYEYFYHKFEPDFVVKEFLEIFCFENEERQAIRSAFLEIIRKYRVSLPDLCSQKVAIHLMLMRNRMNHGNILEINPVRLRTIQKFYEYEVAEAITKELAQFPTFTFTVSETAFIAILLLTGVDLYHKPVSAANYYHFYTQSKTIAHQILQHLSSQFHIIFDDFLLEDDLISTLIPLVAKINFHVKNIQDTPTDFGYRGRSIVGSPLSMELAYLTAQFIKNAYNYDMDAYDLINFAYVYYNSIIRIQFEHNPRKLILISENSKLAGDSMKTKIMRRYGSFIESIDIFELYELRGIDLIHYDWVISVLPPSVFYIDIPILQVDYFLSEKNMNSIYNEIIMTGYNFQQLMPVIQKEDIHENIQVDTMEELLLFIAKRQTKDQSEAEILNHYLLERANKIDNHNKETCILFQMQNQKPTEISLYRLAKPLFWQQCVLHTVVFFSGNPQNDPRIMKAYEIITRQFNESLYMDELFQCKDAFIYTKILNNSRKSEI